MNTRNARDLDDLIEGMIFHPRVEQIVPCPRNRNSHTEEERARMKATLSNGREITNPVLVARPIDRNVLELIDGELRWETYCAMNREAIPAIFKGVLTAKEIDELRFTTNIARNSYHWLEECQELANLHQQEYSTSLLAKRFRSHTSTMARKVAIGYFPEDLIDLLKQGKPFRNGRETQWSYKVIRSLLPLRKREDKTTFSVKEVSRSLQEADYNALEELVKLANAHHLDLSDLPERINDIRIQWEEDAREEEVQKRLEELRKETKQEQEELIEQVKEKAVQEKQKELKKALDKIRELQKEKAELEAFPEEAKAELAKKDKALKEMQEELEEIVRETEEIKAEAKKEAAETAEKRAQAQIKKWKEQNAKDYEKQKKVYIEAQKKKVANLEQKQTRDFRHAQSSFATACDQVRNWCYMLPQYLEVMEPDEIVALTSTSSEAIKDLQTFLQKLQREYEKRKNERKEKLND